MISLVEVTPKELKAEVVNYCTEFACILHETGLFVVPDSLVKSSRCIISYRAAYNVVIFPCYSGRDETASLFIGTIIVILLIVMVIMMC